MITSHIRQAKEYLLHGSLSIAEVAYRCGYNNVEHFCRQFKRITGFTPRKFHKQMEGESVERVAKR
ncbi:helix-turn-helix domain-containing protein [Paenibacillus sp. Soil766]|uniref:helix-turn-helix domain-containing protein n=1 Tax=Paenibacillus sp. Soil766 TaxID=1736404 RepID=UPI000A870F92